MIDQPFFPRYGTNQAVTAAASSANAAFASGATDAKQVRVLNSGANIGYFRTYDSTAGTPSTASTADVPVLAGMATTVSKPESHDRIAYISASGTTFQVMLGDGW